MESLAPPRKKSRPDLFPNGNGPYQGYGLPSDLDRGRYPPSDGFPYGDSGRYRPSLDTLGAERESFSTGLGSKSKACLKFFSTSGCPYGEGCHFAHYMPGGIASLGLSQGSNVTGAGGMGARKSSLGSTLLVSPFNQESAPGGYKTRMCKNFETPEGCRFADKCHFAHGEKEMRKVNGSANTTERSLDRFSSPLGRGTAGVLEDKFALRGYREPTPPGLAAAASFGAVSTAKISIDASLAGVIIGKGGINAKSICRVTGAKLSIRDHESDSNLKNIEMEGSFDQIKQASAMVRELLVHKDVTPVKPGGFGSHNYKTKLCENYPKGSCTFGDRCHFAHGQSELREGIDV